MGFPYFISYIPTLLLSVMYAAMMWRVSSKSQTDFGERLQFWILTVAYVVVMKGSFLVVYSTSPDEHQWIFSARAFAQDPLFWFKEYFPFEVSRSWTVLPLGILTSVIGEVSFVHARILFMLFFFANIHLLHSILSERFDRIIVNRALVFIVLLYCMTTRVDYAAYNSEMPALFFILLSIRFLLKSIVDNNPSNAILLLAFFSVFIPFTKEQALYLALFLWACGFWYLLRVRYRRKLVLYVAVSLITVLFLISPLLVFDGLSDFINICLISLQYQSNGFGMVEKDIINQFFVLNFLELVFLNAMWFFPFLFLIYFLISSLFLRLLKIQIIDFKSKQDVIFAMLSMVVLITIYLPRNGIRHYCIFLIPVAVWAIAYSLERVAFKREWLTMGMYLLPFTIGIDPNFRKEIFPVRGYIKAEEIFAKDAVLHGMEQHVPKGSKVMIWGWANHYYNMFDCLRCSRFVYPQFAFGFYTEKSFVDDCYIEDLRVLQPEYIVQAVGDKCFYFDDSVKFDMINHHPEMRLILEQSYQKVFHKKGIKIFKRR